MFYCKVPLDIFLSTSLKKAKEWEKNAKNPPGRPKKLPKLLESLVFHAYWLDKMTVKQTAEAYGISERTVKRIVAREKAEYVRRNGEIPPRGVRVWG